MKKPNPIKIIFGNIITQKQKDGARKKYTEKHRCLLY